jgi:steroid delta-isomerase-like uncharacterized protein
MQDSNQTLVARYYDEICNGRKLQTADEIVAAGHRYHDPSHRGTPDGPDGIKQVTAAYHKAYPDAHWTVESMVTAGDTVVVRWTGRGTHNGPLGNMAPTGKRVEVPGICMFRIAGGKIAESWNYWDTYGMMAQLGAVPAFGGANARAAG